MSADNYYLIRKDSGGQFVPVMGFASEDGTPEIRYDHQPRFDTVNEALVWAWDRYTEYGVRVHPECGVSPFHCPTCNGPCTDESDSSSLDPTVPSPVPSSDT